MCSTATLPTPMPHLTESESIRLLRPEDSTKLGELRVSIRKLDGSMLCCGADAQVPAAGLKAWIEATEGIAVSLQSLALRNSEAPELDDGKTLHENGMFDDCELLLVVKTGVQMVVLRKKQLDDAGAAGNPGADCTELCAGPGS